MAEEYQQVAALVCLDIDLLAKIAENEDLDAEFLRGSIRLLKEKKDALINDPEVREMRFGSTQLLFNLKKL